MADIRTLKDETVSATVNTVNHVTHKVHKNSLTSLRFHSWF